MIDQGRAFSWASLPCGCTGFEAAYLKTTEQDTMHSAGLVDLVQMLFMENSYGTLRTEFQIFQI